MKRHGRAAAIAFASLIVVAIAAAPVGATTTVRYFPAGSSPPPDVTDFGLLIQGDAAGEAASVRLLESPFRFRVGSAGGGTTTGASLVAGSGCSLVSGGVECNEGGTFKITATLGGGNDSLGEASTISASSGENMNVDGGSGNDTLTGGAGTDTLRGSSDNDTLRGMGEPDSLFGDDGADSVGGDDGNDTVTGGLGLDTFFGGAGNDTIAARDGVRDTSANCGPGTDVAQYDLQDARFVSKFNTDFIPTTGCETIQIAALDDGPPATAIGRRLAIRQDGTLTVRIACPSKARVRCRGSADVRDRRPPSRSLASVSYDVPIGATRRVRAPLTGRERALLRGRGRVLVTTFERGRSRRGPRGAVTEFSVA
jgi:hypothetical protein